MWYTSLTVLIRKKNSPYWADGERAEGLTQNCAAASPSGEVISLKSELCSETKPYLCMGASGAVRSRECGSK